MENMCMIELALKALSRRYHQGQPQWLLTTPHAQTMSKTRRYFTIHPGISQCMDHQIQR
jgi:hypothetical protein